MRFRDHQLYFGSHAASQLTARFGSPLYVYEEDVLRARCRELKGLLARDNFRVNYSCKANANVALLRIIREEGLQVDAMSPGEIFLAQAAGYEPREILFIPNNVSRDELRYAIERGIMVSIDSLSQLQYYCELNPGGEVFVRVNPGIGDGHHHTVVTGGKAKFGVAPGELDAAAAIAARAGVTIVGLNMHIGSLFLKPDNYLSAIRKLLEIAGRFERVRYIDFGGGIGVPNKPAIEGMDATRDIGGGQECPPSVEGADVGNGGQECPPSAAGEARFPLREFADKLERILRDWEQRTGRRDVTFMIEPGRYVVAECGAILATAHSIKEVFGVKYIGTDLGFNVLMRPVLYRAYHEIVVCNRMGAAGAQTPVETVTICGNLCESGDLVAQDRPLPPIELGDTLAVLNAGAYGFAMSSNYNGRLRPAEILITTAGHARVIRKRERLEYLLLNQCG